MSHTPDNSSDKTAVQGRRQFLRALGLGTAAAGAAASLGHVTFVQAKGTDEQPSSKAAGQTLYRETDHVRAFYATLRD
ncbi:formate dehydrogenase region TAT target [Modicisalibacter ilicicola DSM 19980]|uniref:Formate dehydrogenase region TAT target n=1 Tax=Modicisalibacter ilicicola DSM 19980 TaxID=1121942 RepID=A0A1M4XKG1_9GAMM|nr:twin-arginine translocation signal domain-containing protein [Halomonas ilicicola]SHE94107.1 formate dehydrogenase region TAT target [Halomonas ilicicola DSM 19980]